MPGVTVETVNLPGGGTRDVLIYHDDNGPAQLLGGADVQVAGRNALEDLTQADESGGALAFSQAVVGVEVENTGASDVVFTINSTAFTITAGTVRTIYQATAFTTITVTTTGTYRATGLVS